jgi:hypothetical protein
VRASVQISTGSGAIKATGFCGFSLRAVSDSGSVSTTSECSADRLELRSRTGDVRAVAPSARYTIDAQSDTGDVRTRGLVPSEDAPFRIQALSTTGDVTIAAATWMTAAIDLSPHLRAARRTLLYLVVGLGQGLTYLLVIGGGLALGVVLAPLWIGLPLLVGTARLTWRLAEGERRQANRLLASHIPPVPPPPSGRGVREQLGNHIFLDSGLLRTFDQVQQDEIGTPAANWIDDYFFAAGPSPAEQIAARTVELIEDPLRGAPAAWQSPFFASQHKLFEYRQATRLRVGPTVTTWATRARPVANWVLPYGVQRHLRRTLKARR